ncbi:hypothetical protein E8E15_004220 [Penicillium rubens]|uniref:F-box domain-containing protein n=1 Tax=Penicillium chrysogenum TaxID=5076 RepID=A0ABQ8WD82_PENCH|nr:uncharacterized protein N7489_004753 [Penicillium chrysogenum]KAF3012718.1 hypothetical protein E8E15_004220 [Penicillium rubens]KAJ5244657.1 hypothetical protein N7489_004753 [Penicillium chrysogenum]KAJ5264572.1 hypothetical protein N7505_007365 [Penicillium chrysogenum]
MTLHGGSAWVALLPSEIILQIVESLSRFELKTFSCINKRLRELCVPSIFSKVKFEFSKSGLEALNHLLGSDVRRHVRSMTYVTTELLEPETLEFERFRFNTLAPNNCEENKGICELYNYTLRDTGNEHLDLICAANVAALSSALRELPRLAELKMHFCPTMVGANALESYLAFGMSMTAESYEHHIRVLTKAIRVAGDTGNMVRAICLRKSDCRRLQNAGWIGLLSALEGLLNDFDTYELKMM